MSITATTIGFLLLWAYYFCFTTLFQVSYASWIGGIGTTTVTTPYYNINHKLTRTTSRRRISQSKRSNVELYVSSSTSSNAAFDQQQFNDNNTKKKNKKRIRNDVIESAKDNDEEIFNLNNKLQDKKFLERNNHWIIFVDDEESIRQSVGEYIYESGYQLTTCSDAAAVQDVLTGKNPPPSTSSSSLLIPKLPSCIISDIRMPGGIDGIELLHWIREEQTNIALRRVPVILLTAKGLTTDRIEGYKAGADIYLSKPFIPEELLATIDNVIKRREQIKNNGNSGSSSLIDIQNDIDVIKELVIQQNMKKIKKTNIYLTSTQREILELVCKGYTNIEIANTRQTSKHFVSKILKQIYDITHTNNKTQLLKWAIQTGYINP